MNVYATKWEDKGLLSPRVTINGISTRSAIRGQDALHKGLELEFNTKFTPKLDIGGLMSFGDWRWANDVKAELRSDVENSPIINVNVYSENVLIGNHPQSQLGIKGRYQINNTLDVGGQYIYNAKLYSDYDVTGRTEFGSSNLQPYQLDSYGVLDLRIGARFNLGSLGAYAQIQGYNVLDEIYWARGIEGNNELREGFPSYGRTLNFSIKLNF